MRLDIEPSVKRARASKELSRQTAARTTETHAAVALKATCSLLLIILQGHQDFESQSLNWALAATSQILGSSGQYAASLENYEDFCSTPAAGGQLPSIFHGLVQALVASATHEKPSAVQSRVHELLHQRVPFGALWLVLFAVRVLNPANRVEDMHTPVKQAARILMKLAAPGMLHPSGALDDTDRQVSFALLFVAFLPTVCNAASQALRHRSRPRAERDRSSRQLGNSSGVYNACASDLGLEIAAYLYGAWVDHRTRIEQHMTDKLSAEWGVHLCNLVLAQLCFGVSSLFQQLFAYDPAGTQYQSTQSRRICLCVIVRVHKWQHDDSLNCLQMDSKELLRSTGNRLQRYILQSGVVLLLGVPCCVYGVVQPFDPLLLCFVCFCAKLWDKINNFPTSTATSLQGWLPILTPIMAELRQVWLRVLSCAAILQEDVKRGSCVSLHFCCS